MTTDDATDLVRLSSRTTPFWKRVFTPLWSGAFGAFAAAAWLDLLGSPPLPRLLKWAFLLVWLVFTPLFQHWFGGLSDVWLDGDTLVVGDPRRGTRIPLSDVQAMEESRFQQVKTVTLTLRHHTPIGDRVTFPTPLAWQAPFSDHPVVKLLKERHPELAAPTRPRLP